MSEDQNDFVIPQQPSKEEQEEWLEKLMNKHIIEGDEVRADLNEEEVIHFDSIPGMKRICLQDGPMTMDYWPQRKTILIDSYENKKVVGLMFV